MSNSKSFLSVAPLDNSLVKQVEIESHLTPKTTRVSVASDGTQANRMSDHPSISADGRYVAFSSRANNLVSGDTQYIGSVGSLDILGTDIFIRDRQTGITERVNVASDGTQANGMSDSPSISADGRYVAFSSKANNLVPNDTNDRGHLVPNLFSKSDIFIRDRQTGTTERVSVASDGTQANDGSETPSISANGRYVAFQSYAKNLVPGDTNGQGDIFVRDLQTGTTERVNVASDGTQARYDSWHPSTSISAQSISADGRYVVFRSYARNLVPGDTNGQEDIFVRDRQTGTTERVNVAADGTQANNRGWQFSSISISADGRYVAFSSYADNLVPGDTNGQEDIFVHDRQTRKTERVNIAGNQANDFSWNPSISADGRYVAFNSYASNLVPNDTNNQIDIFVHDRQTRRIERINLASDGTQANSGYSWFPSSISADGRYVAFESDASNLISGDTNGYSDIFVRDRGSLFVNPDPNGNNIIDGTPKKDLLLGTSSSDRINGFAGDDTLIGRTGDDILYGDFDNDSLFGNEGNDRLFGDYGRDSLFGGNGDDILDGGADNDLLVGGLGADRFVLREGNWYTKGLNTIVDYLDGTDSFLLDGGLTFEKLTISQGEGKTIISVTDTNEELAALIGIEANSIGAEDFSIWV